MGIWICLDIGSTWTKATAVDPDALRIVGTASARTTVETDVNTGVSEALAKLSACTGHMTVEKRLACSSAAGGLRMVAAGLVPELTAEAARRASFSAGAKVIRTFSHELTASDLADLSALHPDILLLCGGTDGGNRRVLLHNAAALAGMAAAFPVVLAGNRSVSDEAAAMLRAGGKQVTQTENVMPELGRLNLEPARETIRDVFLRHIVKAKGLDRLTALIGVLPIPTPFAVLNAVRLLAEGFPGEDGWGDMLALDPGGATTDVYSMAKGEPALPGILWKGLPEPYAKRTVEGDLGIRFNARSVTDTFEPGIGGIRRLAVAAGVSEDAASGWLETIDRNPGILPVKNFHTTGFPLQDMPCGDASPSWKEGFLLDKALVVRSLQIALQRHAGTLEETYAPAGRVHVQIGKDLTGIRRLLLTGGPLVNAPDPAGLVSAILQPSKISQGVRTLLPDKMDMFLDQSYILAAMGLMAETQPLAALRIMKKEMKPL